MSSTKVYPITQAVVLSHDPDTNSLQVMLRDGQGLGQPVKVLYPGACDALRINQQPMPGRGTMGVIAFVNNDIKSGVWLGAVVGAIADAISSPVDDPFLKYESHWSGYWNSLDQGGNENTHWTDGSTLTVGSGFVPTRHIQNTEGVREAVPVAATDRPTATPFPFTFMHSTGTMVKIDALGNVTVSGVAAITADAVGAIDATSKASITATAPTITLDGSTEVYLTTPEVMVSQNMTVGANLTIEGNATSSTGTIDAYTLKATTGATGTFTAESGQTITVQYGIITNIS